MYCSHMTHDDIPVSHVHVAISIIIAMHMGVRIHMWQVYNVYTLNFLDAKSSDFEFRCGHMLNYAS
jgi:hypothetical protein